MNNSNSHAACNILNLEFSTLKFIFLDYKFDWSKSVALLEFSSFLHETCNAQLGRLKVLATC